MNWPVTTLVASMSPIIGMLPIMLIERAMLVAVSSSFPRCPIIMTTTAKAALRRKVWNPAGMPNRSSRRMNTGSNAL